MSMTEKIRILLVKRNNMSEADLARKMGLSPQNLNNKMKRDNFTEKDLLSIAQALDCTLDISFKMNDTNESVQKNEARAYCFSLVFLYLDFQIGFADLLFQLLNYCIGAKLFNFA